MGDFNRCIIKKCMHNTNQACKREHALNIYIYLLCDNAHVILISHTGQLQMDRRLITNIRDGNRKL